MSSTGTAGPAYMGYFVRPMRLEDISQVAMAEQECFPTGWGPTPFQRQLQNHSTAYLVACRAIEPAGAGEEAMALMAGATVIHAQRPVLQRLMAGIKEAISPSQLPVQDFSQWIAGYVGLWFVADEGHITAIGTREIERRKGIGELLLLSSVELSQQRGAQMVTLETRVTNYPAQSLYLKYGFQEVGIRKGYYTDNREDALIMTTPNINSQVYQLRLMELREGHSTRWGESVRILG